MVPAAQELADRLVKRLAGNEIVLPPYPAVATQLQRLPRDTVKMQEVASIVATDASLAASILRQASSAAFGGVPPATLEAALAKLGLDTVVRTAITVALGKSAGAAGPLADLRRDEWRRSLLSAVFAKELASRRAIDPSQAFLAGLLHDFGSLVALACLEDEKQLPTLPAVTWRSVVDKVHIELGSSIANRWKLATPICDVIAHHHMPTNCPPANRSLAQLIATVDHIITILDRSAMTGIAALIEVPGLATDERYRIGALMPQIGEQMAKFELAAREAHGESAVEPDDILEGGFRVDFPVGSKKEMAFQACALSPDRIAFHSPTAMSPGWLTELVICETSPALQLLANVVACTPQSKGDFVIVCQPFGLGGDQKKGWSELVAIKRSVEQPAGQARTRR
ncbi:MAG: HDOD domain-containing protein [Kofleriaceae bacterium]